MMEADMSIDGGGGWADAGGGWGDAGGVLSVLFGVMPGDSYDLLGNSETYRGRIPSDLLPIAEDPGGKIIAIAIKGDNKGSVYFWDHEEEVPVEEGHEPGRSNAYLVAGSFDEFINSLEVEDD